MKLSNLTTQSANAQTQASSRNPTTIKTEQVNLETQALNLSDLSLKRGFEKGQETQPHFPDILVGGLFLTP